MKKFVIECLAVTAILVLVIPPQKAQAFWLFDLFKGGQVKGDSVQVGTTNPTVQPPANNDERLLQTVNSSKLTDAQKREFRVKLAVIKTKREDLTKLEQALINWLKSNKIEAGVTGPWSVIMPMATPSGVRRMEPLRTNVNPSVSPSPRPSETARPRTGWFGTTN